MIYTDFCGERVSRLGFGAMRLPTVDQKVDEEKAKVLIEEAYHSGINYFDTAFSYHDGASEQVLGNVMASFPRESWFLASKMPGHEGSSRMNPAAIFEEQLRRLRTDYFDFYLLHNVCEHSMDIYNDEKLGLLRYVLEQKKTGRIRHLGFSSHAQYEVLKDYLDRHPDCFDFVQIQLNYADWTLQDADKKYALLTERNIPVVVMEPCRGGRLAHVSETVAQKMEQLRPGETPASWAFRWFHGLPNAAVILSGMTTEEQLRDNLNTFRELSPLTEEQTAFLESTVSEMAAQIPCTACRYCCTACPKSIEIPTLLKLYSDCTLQPSVSAGMTVDAMPAGSRLWDCIGCGKCTNICPQNIAVSDTLQKLKELLKDIPHWVDVAAKRAQQHPTE